MVALLFAAPASCGDAVPGLPAPPDMVWVPAGSFWMGGDAETTADARPVHPVQLDGFWLDRTEVTNEAFAIFVEATGHVSLAEKAPRPADLPGVPAEKLIAGSVVFRQRAAGSSMDDPDDRWAYLAGASWRHPDGPGSSIAERAHHPVVHVAWDDAVAYCRWADKRLPTEAEWEYAARGGPEPREMRTRFTWGNTLPTDGVWQANVWQGRFPAENTVEDGFEGSAPVASFPPNRLGLHDMSGNVWEWIADWYRPDYYADSPGRNPPGPADGFDPAEPGIAKRVLRGGSFLCSAHYCLRYTTGARGQGAPDSGAVHVGFRCARSRPVAAETPVSRRPGPAGFAG